MTAAPPVWKFLRTVPPPPPVHIETGGFYRTRGGALAVVLAPLTIRPSDTSSHPTWHGWIGRTMDTGRKCAWGSAGDHSPVAEHPYDLIDVAGN